MFNLLSIHIDLFSRDQYSERQGTGDKQENEGGKELLLVAMRWHLMIGFRS